MLAPVRAILIRSLRGFPYTLETALADIIDNSITAGATDIKILADANGGYPRIAVVDNGSGMSEDELQAAMRLGSKDPSHSRDADDLGRFGLGLKTASFSQCTRLTVVSRQDNNWHAARWDLDHVIATDEWEVQVPDQPRSLPYASDLTGTGTLVLLERLDRVIDSESLDEVAAEFNHRVVSAGTHLELVFHRFLEGEKGLSRIRISLNGRQLIPMNPFNPTHKATIVEPDEVIGVADTAVRVKAYTLPHFSKVSGAEWERYAGKRGYLREQGFYLYRARRLIVHGTWFGLMRQTELTKLARVQIDIPNGMDELWKIDVLKASARPPHVVRKRLAFIIERLGKMSKRVHVNRGQALTTQESFPLWERRAAHEGIRYSIDSAHPTIVALRQLLDSEADAQFRKVLQLLGASLPIDALIVDLGENPQQVRAEDPSADALGALATTMIQMLHKIGTDWPEIEKALRMNTLLGANWPVIAPVLQTARETQL